MWMSPTNKVVVSMVILFILMCPVLQPKSLSPTNLAAAAAMQTLHVSTKEGQVGVWRDARDRARGRVAADCSVMGPRRRRWHSPLAAAPQPRTGRWPATRRHHPPRHRAAATTVRDTVLSDLQLWFFRCTVLCISLKYKMYVLYCYSVSSVMSRYECWVL